MKRYFLYFAKKKKKKRKIKNPPESYCRSTTYTLPSTMKISVRRYQSHCKRLCLASEKAHTQGLKGAGYSYSLACASTIFFLLFFLLKD